MLNIYNDKELKGWVLSQAVDGEAPVMTANNLKDLTWIEGHKEQIIRAVIGQFIKKRLFDFLKNDQHHEKYELLQNDDSLPEWAQKSLNNGEKLYTFNSTNVPETNIGQVKDYLYTVAESYINDSIRVAEESGQKKGTICLTLDYLKNKYLTWEKALKGAEQWHQELAQKKKEKANLDKSLIGAEKVMDLPDGLTAYRLLTSEALDYESEHMGHCVGQGYYDEGVKKGTTEIYSIRDSKGEPHVTFDIRFDKKWKKIIAQCKGKGNEKPVKTYFSAIKEFVQEQGFEFQNCDDMKDIGFFQQDDQIYNVYDLPKDFNVKGDLDIGFLCVQKYGFPNLSGVKIQGNFIIPNGIEGFDEERRVIDTRKMIEGKLPTYLKGQVMYYKFYTEEYVRDDEGNIQTSYKVPDCTFERKTGYSYKNGWLYDSQATSKNDKAKFSPVFCVLNIRGRAP